MFIHKIGYIDLLDICFINENADLIGADVSNTTSKSENCTTGEEKFTFSKFGRNYLMGFWGATVALQLLDSYFLGGAFSGLLPVLYKVGVVLAGAYSIVIITADDEPSSDINIEVINSVTSLESENLSKSNDSDIFKLFDKFDL